VHVFSARRIAGTSTHGTGCTLASAIATGLAQGVTLQDAVVRAREFVREAIRNGLALGHGAGPVGIGRIASNE
jgi:hydroxymethylpyrimidine/phosphomethylpyrimidine kinase